MPLENPNWTADGTISPSVIVTQSTTPFRVVTASTGQPLLGVSQAGTKFAPIDLYPTTTASNAPAALPGDQIKIYGQGESGIQVTVGAGGLTAGDFIGSDVNGYGIAVTASGTYYVGKALDTVAAGQLCNLQVIIGSHP